HDGDAVLALAAAAETDSEHPLARAIVAAARQRGLDIPAASGFTSEPALGVSAQVAETRVQVGGPALLDARGSRELAVAAQWRTEGAIILHVLLDGQVAAAL
ncbi:HAD family hydrolase, partial [Mycobacteroides abscessus subsp. abscessus]